MKIREPFNALSHAFGALSSLVGFVVLGLLARGLVQLLVYCIYGFSLVFLYSSSALYHALATTERVRNRLLKLDRTAIAVLIAGTATPLAVLKFDAFQGTLLAGVLWAVVGFLLVTHLLFSSFPRWFYLGLYLVMGWSGLFVVETLLERLSPAGFFWLVAGGVFYTVGALVYALDWPVIRRNRFEAHELWHVFCLLGSVTHYVLIAGYTL